MNKKKTILIVTLALAISLLVVTAFAASPSNAGYEALKELIKNNTNDEFKGGMLEGEFEIYDNSKLAFSIDGSFAGDEDNKVFSGEFKVLTDELDKELVVYGADGEVYISDVDSNEIYVAKCDDESEEFNHDNTIDCDGEFSKNEEALLDYFVGDLANKFELINKNDGSYDIRLELTKSEIPTIVNLMTSLDSEKKHSGRHNFEHENFSNLDVDAYPLLAEICNSKTEITELIENIEVEYLNITINVNSNDEIEGMLFSIKVSDDDLNSENHVMTYNGNIKGMELEDVEISKIELEGKTIIELPEFDSEEM